MDHIGKAPTTQCFWLGKAVERGLTREADVFYCPSVRALVDISPDLSLIKYQPIAVSVVNKEYRLFLFRYAVVRVYYQFAVLCVVNKDSKPVGVFLGQQLLLCFLRYSKQSMSL